jgi:molecular chaperone DnaK
LGEPPDKRTGQRAPSGLLLRLSYGTVDEFVERFASNVSRGGLFIRTREPRPVGTAVAFELRLAGGETALKGQGVVRWVQEAQPAAHPPVPSGMGVQFTHLDAASRAVVERIVREREALAGGTPVVAPRPALTPEPTRAPSPVIPVPAPTPSAVGSPVLTPAPRPAASPAPRPGEVPALTPQPQLPAQADLSRPHRVEKLSAGPARVEIGLPAEPQPIAKRSRAIIGIDLGTTNSCAAVVKDGRPYVVPSREGHNTVPSVVALNARNRIVVGHLARAQLLTNPRATVYGAKRLVGRPFESDVVQEIRSKFAYEIVPDANGLAAVRLGPETLSLEQISALILREVKEVAQNHLGEEVNRAVITVPAYYNERQRAAVRLAGALAGLHVERILNEPTAAALAYAFGRHLNQRVLVYDLGGGTFDASVLELSDNVYEVVSTGGDTFLGGVDFDNRIVDRLLASWRERNGAEFSGDRVALSRLVDAAERAKCALSERSDFPIHLPFLAMRDGQPLSFETTLSRADLVGMVEPLVDRTLEVCQEVLAAKGIGPGDIDEVLLVGGQSRMPLVHQKVSAYFGKPPSHSVHPDEAVAIGAALLAFSLGTAEGVVLIDVLPMSIGIGLPGGRVKRIIERNTALPARKQYGLSTSRDGQTEFELVVYQGESAAAGECEYLGTLRLSGLPSGPRGMVKIAVTFELGAECLLTVTARELHSGRQVQAVMSTKEGPNAARQKLEAAGADPTATTGSFPEPPRPAPGPAAGSASSAPAAPPRGFGAFLRRIFGREAR